MKTTVGLVVIVGDNVLRVIPKKQKGVFEIVPLERNVRFQRATSKHVAKKACRKDLLPLLKAFSPLHFDVQTEGLSLLVSAKRLRFDEGTGHWHQDGPTIVPSKVSAFLCLFHN